MVRVPFWYQQQKCKRCTSDIDTRVRWRAPVNRPISTSYEDAGPELSANPVLGVRSTDWAQVDFLDVSVASLYECACPFPLGRDAGYIIEIDASGKVADNVLCQKA